jgi:ABC-2 type transport system ATP-binding protein
MIELKNIYKKYGDKTILNGIDMQFASGKIYGIMGSNGAGKTTLFKCIAGLEKYEGEIVSDLNPLKNHIGLLWTVPYFFSKITGKEYIEFICFARNMKINNIEEKNIFDLPLNRYASLYSTGMKKKLALTAVLPQKNEVFILDEPFNGVDIQSNILIESIIKELRDKGKIILISSHILSTLSNNANEIYYLKDGNSTRFSSKNHFEGLENFFDVTQAINKIASLNI